MLPATQYLLSDAFRDSLQFSAPGSPNSPASAADHIDHNTLDHTQLAHAVMTHGPQKFPLKDMPRIGVRLNKNGLHDAAKLVNDHHNAMTNPPKPAPAAPTEPSAPSRPNMPAHVGVLSPSRKKAVTAFVNHPNPDVQKHVGSHNVHQPGLTAREAYKRAEQAYDSFHAQHMGVPMASASQNSPQQSPAAGYSAGEQRRSKDARLSIAARMGLNPGPWPDEPSMDWKKPASAPLPMDQVMGAASKQAPTAAPVDNPKSAANVAKTHADAVRSGRPVPAQHVDRVAKNLEANGYHAEAAKVRAGSKADTEFAPPRVGRPAQATATRPAPKKPPAIETPEEELPDPKFGYSTHTAPPGKEPGEPPQPTTHGRFAALLNAAKQGNLKEHIEGGLGNFFDKFEKHGNKFLNKLGIDTGDREFSRGGRLSAALADLEFLTYEFARKSAPNQMGLFAPEEISAAVAPKSRTRNLRKPASGQKSFGWDEDSHPREKTSHDSKRAGEFAPKDEHREESKPEPEPEPTKPTEDTEKPQYVARGNEVYDADGKRHAAFRTEEKARDAAERWSKEGKPGASPAAKNIESQFPSLAGFVDPEEPREQLKEIADEHLASEIPPAQNPVSGPKATDERKKESVSTDDQPNYANLPASDDSDPDAPKDDDEYGPVRDFGEKLGGARKDRAVERGSSPKKEKSNQPAWMKRYLIAPVATGAQAGKFTIIDAKTGRSALRGIYMDSREQAEKMLPAVEVARKHDVRNVAKQGEPDNWAVIRHVNDRKRPVIKGGFKTSEEATGYMVNRAAEILATNTRITNAIHPAMENVTREGTSRRPNGKHATEHDFEKFGFRGVEFGKWVNQAEGRHILDHAYDSLADMSEAIGVPAKALSLDGELGLGFGSRGHGNAGWGGAANAHYERGYGAINITKLHGAGSLAHEWMHAVDHWLGRKSGKSSDQKILNKYNDDVFKTGETSDDYVSHGTPRRPKEGFRAEVAAAIDGVRDAITSRDVKYKEDQSTHERIQKKRTEALGEKLKEFRETMSRDYSKEKYQHYKGKRGLPASPEVMKEVDELSDKLLAGDYGEDVQHGESSPDTPANKSNWGHTMPANVARLSDLHKQLRGNKGYSATKGYGGTKLDGIIADIKTAAMMHRTGLANLKEAKEQKEKTGKVRSEFYSQAGKMDQGQSEDYWSTPHEMMARAFESYVYDKLKAKKNHNDFLAYEKHNDLPEYRMFNVKPYPEGEERPKINAAFDHLFSILSKHEMDGEHRSTVKKVDRESADTKTWRGYLKATDTAHWIAGIESHIKGRDGIVRFAEKKGAPTKSQFFSKPAGTSIEDWEKKIKSENKSGKFFVIKNGEQQFSRSSDLESALSRLNALSASLRNAS